MEAISFDLSLCQGKKRQSLYTSQVALNSVTSAHSYTWLDRGIVREKCLANHEAEHGGHDNSRLITHICFIQPVQNQMCQEF